MKFRELASRLQEEEVFEEEFKGMLSKLQEKATFEEEFTELVSKLQESKLQEEQIFEEEFKGMLFKLQEEESFEEKFQQLVSNIPEPDLQEEVVFEEKFQQLVAKLQEEESFEEVHSETTKVSGAGKSFIIKKTPLQEEESLPEQIVIAVEDQVMPVIEEIEQEVAPVTEEEPPVLIPSVEKYLTNITGTGIKHLEEKVLDRSVDDLKNKIKYLEQWVGKIANAGPGSGEVKLRRLDDVDRLSIEDDKFLAYNAASRKFEFRYDIAAINAASRLIQTQRVMIQMVTRGQV